MSLKRKGISFFSKYFSICSVLSLASIKTFTVVSLLFLARNVNSLLKFFLKKLLHLASYHLCLPLLFRCGGKRGGGRGRQSPCNLESQTHQFRIGVGEGRIPHREKDGGGKQKPSLSLSLISCLSSAAKAALAAAAAAADSETKTHNFSVSVCRFAFEA